MAGINQLPFKVFEYSTDNFGSTVMKSAPIQSYVLSVKPSFRYLVDYLPKLGAKSIVLESDYLDRDFSVDHSKYYTTCFKPYKRICHRLHFFNIQIRTEDLVRTLQDSSTSPLTPNNLQESYLGFVIIRPLPETVFGRTCLKTVTSTEQEKFVTKFYNAHLYGIRLRVESLAFMEQDSVTSACASVAIWTKLHITSDKFHHELLAPVQITEKATNKMPVANRTFPNRKGLNVLQMTQVLRSVKLEPVVLDLDPTDELSMKLFLYAYLRSGIPLIMAYNQYENGNIGGPPFLHAVTVTGYSLDQQPVTVPATEPLMMAYRIKKLYVHNDQLGPFSAIMHIKETHFRLFSDKDLCAQVLHLIVGLPSQIRITTTTITKFICVYDALFTVFSGTGDRLEWDLHLCDTATYKSDLHLATYLSPQERFQLITKSLPHYMWRARAALNTLLITDLLFDATDVEQGDIFLFGVDSHLKARTLRQCLKNEIGNIISNTPISTQRFLQLYLNS